MVIIKTIYEALCIFLIITGLCGGCTFMYICVLFDLKKGKEYEKIKKELKENINEIMKG